MRFRKTILVVLPAVLITAFAYMAQAKSVNPTVGSPAAVPSAWQDFTFGEGAFKLSVPVKPVCQNPDKGYYIQSHLCQAATNEAEINIAYVNLPSDDVLDREHLDELYTALLADVAAREHGELMAAVDIRANNVLGKSYQVKTVHGVIYYRSFIHRGFSASVGVSAAAHSRIRDRAPDIDRMLAAFTPN